MRSSSYCTCHHLNSSAFRLLDTDCFSTQMNGLSRYIGYEPRDNNNLTHHTLNNNNNNRKKENLLTINLLHTKVHLLDTNKPIKSNMLFKHFERIKSAFYRCKIIIRKVSERTT